MPTALYNVVLLYRGKSHKIACVYGKRTVTPMGNWFKDCNDFYSPDRRAVRNALPHGLRRAWDTAFVWHADDAAYASATLYGSRGKALAIVQCEGYTV